MTAMRNPPIADQVSSSPQSVGQVTDVRDNLSKSDSAENHQEESNDQTTVEQRQEPDLPSLAECLYGVATRKGPFIPDDYDDDENMDDFGEGNSDASDSEDKKDKKDGDMDVAIDDDGLNSRWSQDPKVNADYHDIDMTVLRKLCSQGISIPHDTSPNPSPKSNSSGRTRKRETCHRGVAWRVLLEQLPSRDIHATWPEIVPPQRMLYRELVEKYMDDAIDPGIKLKYRTHRQRRLPTNINNSSNHSPTNELEIMDGGADENGKNDDENEAGDKSLDKEHQQLHLGNPKSEDSLQLPLQVENDRNSWNASTEFNHSADIKDIYDVFPPTSKYKKLWHQCGIVLTQAESAAAIGMNKIKIPEELLSDDIDDSSTNEDDPDSDYVELVDMDDEAWKNTTNRSKKDDLFFRFCKDAKLLSEIRRDVVRTNPQLGFYLEPEKNLGIRRHAAIERVLFVWAKLNDHLYVQGMNEIAGLIYYVLATDQTTSGSSSGGNKPERHSSWANHAEADTYFLFHSLMIRMEVRDVFVADLDHDGTSGLHARIANVERLLQRHDPDIFHHLRDNLGIDSSFYVIRWLTALLSREFRLPETIRLWDSLLASTHKENFLRYVCASMVMAARDRLLCSDFGNCLKLLQNYPSEDISMDELLDSSRALWMYETQISVACEKGGITLRKALRVVPPPEGITMAFGKVGPKPLRLAVVKVPGASNTGKFMGAAKRLWNWGGTPSHQSGVTKKEDLIDSILEGKAIFVNNSMSTVNIPEDTTAVASDQDESNSKAEATSVPPPPPPPVTAKSTFRFWNRSRSESAPTTTPLIPEEEGTSSAPLRVWSYSNGDASPTIPLPPPVANYISSDDDDDDVVDEYKNNDDDPISMSERVETNAKPGFWDRMRHRSSSH